MANDIIDSVIDDDGELDNGSEGYPDGGMYDHDVFEDSEDIFANKREGDGPAQEPFTRAEELAPEQIPAKAYHDAPAPVDRSGTTSLQLSKYVPPKRESLVAVFDGNGRPQVARAVNGKRVERYRPPTKAEFEALKQRGRLVKGGLAGVGDDIASLSKQKEPNTWAWALVAAIAVGGGYYWYANKDAKGGKKRRPSED